MPTVRARPVTPVAPGASQSHLTLPQIDPYGPNWLLTAALPGWGRELQRNALEPIAVSRPELFPRDAYPELKQPVCHIAGGVVSPVLSNIYLHYVLDLWFERRFKKLWRGYAGLTRFADDFVATFRYLSDASRFRQEMEERLAAFGLRVAPDKTAQGAPQQHVSQ